MRNMGTFLTAKLFANNSFKSYVKEVRKVSDLKGACNPNSNQDFSNFNYQERVDVAFRKNEKLRLHPIWLRHHCRCEDCINYKTHQRNIIPAKLPELSHISDLRIHEDELNITWRDTHESIYKLNWLKSNTPPLKLQNSKFVLTDKALQKFEKLQLSPKNLVEFRVDYSQFMSNDSEGLAQLLKNIEIYGYGIVKNTPPDYESTKDVVRRISHPQMTIFGDFSEWTNNLEHADTAYTSDYVYLHTDTAYFSEPMGLQMFHCLRHDGTGGLNSIVDGFNVAKAMYEENPDHYNILSRYPVPYQYIDPEKYHFLSKDVIFSHNVFTGELERIRYNPHDLAVINTIPEEDIGNFYEALVNLSERIESSPNWIKLAPGLVIFLHNWRTLHGRTEFTGHRHLCGAYIGNSDWTSKARVLKLLHSDNTKRN